MNTCNNPNYGVGVLQGRLGSVNVCAPLTAVECNSTKPLAPIPNTVGQVRSLLCEVHGALDNLTGALVSVTVPQPCKEPDGKCAAPRPSGLIGELEEIRDGVSAAANRIRALQEGLLL